MFLFVCLRVVSMLNNDLFLLVIIVSGGGLF